MPSSQPLKPLRILVTGATGMVGQSLVKRLSPDNRWEVTVTHRETLDLSWPEAQIQAVLDAVKPDIIINPAALTHVDAAERHPDQAFQANCTGPGILARWTARHPGAYLVHISTDYVFDGNKGTPYRTTDIANPVNAYGASKLAGEKAVTSAAAEQSVIIRTSWLFGSGSKNFAGWVLQAAQTGQPVQGIIDQWGVPTWTDNLCDMISETLHHRPAGILHGCSRGWVSRYEQAQYLFSKLTVSSDRIIPTRLSDFDFVARRPVNTAMESSFDCALSWEEATDLFLATQTEPSPVSSHV